MAKSTTGSGNTPTPKGSTTPRGWAAAPAPVRRAVRLMLAGAAATFIWGIYWVVVTLGFRGDAVTYFVKAGHLTVNQANSQVNGGVLLVVIQAVVFAAAWVLMARMNRDGYGWARIVSTLLFLGWSYHTYGAFFGLRTYIGLGDLILEVLIWGVGVGALVSLWRADSTAYFKPAAAAALAPSAAKSAAPKSPAPKSAAAKSATAKSPAPKPPAAKSAAATRKRRLPARPAQM